MNRQRPGGEACDVEIAEPQGRWEPGHREVHPVSLSGISGRQRVRRDRVIGHAGEPGGGDIERAGHPHEHRGRRDAGDLRTLIDVQDEGLLGRIARVG